MSKVVDVNMIAHEETWNKLVKVFFSQERFIFPFPFFPVRVNCPKDVKEPARDTWQYPSPSKTDTFTNYLATPPLSFIKLGSASNRQVNSGLHISLTSPKGTDSETKRR